MTRQHHAGALEVFDVRWVDETPSTCSAPAPLPCRWHLWHHWALVRVDAHTTYVACAGCGRLSEPTIFQPLVP